MSNKAEYCEYLYNRIKAKVKKSGNHELYTYVSIGLDLGIRQGDILNIFWDQIDFEDKLIKDVYIKKFDKYLDYKLTDELVNILYDYTSKCEDIDRLFPNLKRVTVSSMIRNLTGIYNFGGHDMRLIYTVMKANELKEGDKQ